MDLILTSDFPGTQHPRVLRAMTAATASPRIAWIPSHTEATGEDFRRAQQQFTAVGLTGLELLDIDELRDEVQIAYLHEYDVVFLTGEDAVRFRFNANRSGLSGRLRQCVLSGRTIVAAGGGASLLTPNVSALRLKTEAVEQVVATRGRFDALGAVPYEVVPHGNRSDSEFLDKVRDYSTHVDHDVVVLADGSAIFHNGRGGFDGDGRIWRYRKGNIIEP